MIPLNMTLPCSTWELLKSSRKLTREYLSAHIYKDGFYFCCMNTERAISEISTELGLVVKGNAATNMQLLYDRINELIHNDFQKLVSILYTMDVDENKLKELLKKNPETDAGIIIGQLMIERQEQKIRSRQAYKPGRGVSDAEEW